MHVRGRRAYRRNSRIWNVYCHIEAANGGDFDNSPKIAAILKATRPTAVNLEWAVNRQLHATAKAGTVSDKINIARQTANEIADEDAAFWHLVFTDRASLKNCRRSKQGTVVNILPIAMQAGWHLQIYGWLPPHL